MHNNNGESLESRRDRMSQSWRQFKESVSDLIAEHGAAEKLTVGANAVYL